MKLFSRLTLLFALVMFPAAAEDVVAVTTLSDNDVTTLLGVHVPLNSQSSATCHFNSLIAGVIVDHDSDRVEGIRLICRHYGKVGGTDTSFEIVTARAGTTAQKTTRIECNSGRAVSGLRIRRMSLPPFALTALTIACGSVNPQFGQVISFVDSDLGAGSGAIVTRGSTVVEGSPVGGTGVAQSFDCPGGSPFSRFVNVSISIFGEIDGLMLSCHRTLAPILPSNLTEPDLTTRTIGQQRKMKVTNDVDVFTAEVFNLGQMARTAGGNLYIDMIFNPADLFVTSMGQGCSSISSSRIRCPFQVLARGASLRFDFEIDARRTHPDTPLLIIQASYDIDDADYSNNSYGFATQVVN